MEDFPDRVALVTGAASGIGAAVAQRLRTAGATVYCADLDLQGTDTAPTGEPNARRLALDVREEEAWTAAIHGILAEDGRLDMLVNCVGVSAASPLTDTPLTEWRHVLATNLDGAFLATKHGIRAMRSDGGVIVHVGSASGIRPPTGAAAYSTSKAALRMLATAAAKECRDGGIDVRVNVVSPAGVKTPMWRTMPFFVELTRELGSEEAAFASMSESGGGQFIEPDVVADVVCFLVSDRAQHVTGVELPVDNGWVL